MNFFKKISSKRISTAPAECNNRKFKSKYADNKPLLPSPPLPSKTFLKDDSLLQLNIPDDFSSFDIPQLKTTHNQPIEADNSIEDTPIIIDAPQAVISITAVNNAIICLDPFAKAETEQGTRMNAETNGSTASLATTSENHSELGFEVTEK
jgi:hypothetical protein